VAIVASGGRAVAIETDVADRAALERLVGEAMEIYGRIDVLHSHAGIQVEGRSPRSTRPHGGLLAGQRRGALPPGAPRHAAHAEGGTGSIIVTASNSGVFYDHEMIAYATSKHAAVAMVKQIAIDYGKYGVRVNALCPGWVDTPFNDASPARWAGARRCSPTSGQDPDGRFASVEEIAESILFSPRTAPRS